MVQAKDHHMPEIAQLFSLKSDPDTLLIALSTDLHAYLLSPAFDKNDWKHIGAVELTPDKLWMYAYRPADILQAVAEMGYYIVAPEVYRDILAER